MNLFLVLRQDVGAMKHRVLPRQVLEPFFTLPSEPKTEPH